MRESLLGPCSLLIVARSLSHTQILRTLAQMRVFAQGRGESLLCWLAFAFTSGREECGAQNLWGTFGRASVLKLINSLSSPTQCSRYRMCSKYRMCSSNDHQLPPFPPPPDFLGGHCLNTFCTWNTFYIENTAFYRCLAVLLERVDDFWVRTDGCTACGTASGAL
jgi:hypothetical protein